MHYPTEAFTSFYAHGKLLLSAEYFVLDGALALALPTRLGQSLTVSPMSATPYHLHWKSYDADQSLWFEGEFALPNGNYLKGTNAATGRRLQEILEALHRQKTDAWIPGEGYSATTTLEFPRQWGLGSSATLLALLAQWKQVDPYALLRESFGGSGYDLACAFAEGPIYYSLHDGKPQVQATAFRPTFHRQLHFVYLGNKQDSREGIQRYRHLTRDARPPLSQVDTLTRRLVAAATLEAFNDVLLEHENLVARTLQLPRAQTLYFQDFPGVIKSLGAWGGDFVLASSSESAEVVRNFFNEKGYPIVVSYEEMIFDHQPYTNDALEMV